MSRRESTGGKKNTLAEIQRLQADRDERRRVMEQVKSERAAEAARNIAEGRPGDVDFQKMIREYRAEYLEGRERPHGTILSDDEGEGKDGADAATPKDSKDDRICIAVRKRPVNAKEIRKSDYDSITCVNPLVIVHDCKLRVDGITKYLDNTSFSVDHTFHEDDTTEDVYEFCVKKLVPFTVAGGRGTVFAYGQTGSGKTYTMVGIQQMAIADLFAELERRAAEKPDERALVPYVSFFEIYGGRCQDLLNNRSKLAVREDGNGDVVIAGLVEEEARREDEMTQVIDLGNRNRTTHATESNDESSRSHAICQIVIRYDTADGNPGPVYGKLSLIDLAGSERGADTKSHNRQRRLEGAEINKSLLALKECIRALDGNSTHVPYRGSKLTLVLKDSFTRSKAKTVMISTVSPAASSADHTLNTLRYADRIKERSVPLSMLEPIANYDGARGAARPPPIPPSSSSAQQHQQEEIDGQSQSDRQQQQISKDRRRSLAGGRKTGHSPVRPGDNASSADNRRSSRRETTGGTSSSRPPATSLYAGAGGGGGSEYHSRERDRGDSSLRNSTERERALAEHKSQASAFGALGSAAPRRASSKDRSPPRSLQTREVREQGNGASKSIFKHDDNASKAVEDHQNTVEELFEEEEQLLNLHMKVIQQNAELLTEEGRLLQSMQGDSVASDDVDRYASELDYILGRKLDLIDHLQEKLSSFRESLNREEEQSKSISN